jgi:hypothetical protein
VLAPPLDPVDPSAHEGAQLGRPHTPAQCGVEQLDASDRAPLGAAAQRVHRRLDFR